MIFKPTQSVLILFLFAFTIASSPAQSFADDLAESSSVLRIVFFTPSDVDPPDGVKDRLKESVDYAQQFYGKWLKHWGYDSANPVPVKRDESGSPEILFVKGRHEESSGRYRQLGFEPEVIAMACKKCEIDPGGQVWWIFTYRGPQRRGFRGGGNAKRGGTSTSIYDPQATGKLTGNELGSADVPQNSKASIHELGHAFGLPHIGPIQHDKLGNSLMGPIVKAFESRFPNEERVYLTEASAAMLWKHPLFSGTTKDRELIPKVQIEDFRVAHEADQNRFVVSGKVTTDYPAHSIVIANASSANRSDYWRKCFAGRIAKDNTFRIEVSELQGKDGQLVLVCCFNNGAVVGKDGIGLQSGFAKQYHFEGDKFRFDAGWSEIKSTKQRRGQRPPSGTRSKATKPNAIESK